jgi:ComF family protein
MGIAMEAFRFAAAFIFQPICLGCGKSNAAAVFCTCCGSFPKLTGPRCFRCGFSTSQNIESCGRKHPAQVLNIRSLWWLTPAARVLIHKIKYDGRFELMDYFLNKIEIDLFFSGSATVVPVPLSFDKWFNRGFNQSEFIARRFSKLTQMPLALDLLEKTKDTLPQAGLSRGERLRNLKSSFGVVKNAEVPARVLLIDDVYTTGSTMAACARALARLGVKEIYAWSLFRAPEMD